MSSPHNAWKTVIPGGSMKPLRQAPGMPLYRRILVFVEPSAKHRLGYSR